MKLVLGDLRGRRVHLLGIGGIGVSALARLLVRHGIEVWGCDVRGSRITEALRSEGIRVEIGHDPSHVQEGDIVVYSTAIPEDNAEFRHAVEAGCRVLHRSELLALLVEASVCVGVTGTNGKGTVCSMLTWILECAGLSPTFYIGAMCPNLGTNARAGGIHMVAELDESDGSLVNIHPAMAVLNNLELDHLNYYRDLDHAVETLVRFFEGLPRGGRGFFNADDPGAMQVAARVPGLKRVLFGRSAEADWRYEPVRVEDGQSVFHVRCGARDGSGMLPFGEFLLNVPGAYNLENAIAAIAVAGELGVQAGPMEEALRTFSGLENRYTVMPAGGRRVVKDYMSHPTGMRKVLATARLCGPDRLVVVFKPYRYTMIRYHAGNYAQALSAADEVVVTRMWEGGEEPIPGVDTEWLVERLRGEGLAVSYEPEMEPIVERVASGARQRDCVVFFGGDDLFAIADRLHARFLEMTDE